MARLIDADAFDVMLLPDSSEEFAEGVQYAMELLDKAPTVDAVEVVRCKNCDWYRTKGSICVNPHCTKSYYGCRVREEHFCSYGERKEKDDGNAT